ncbi:hypothetical protein NDU88_006139 [Pleurodeles waltl]|uniref:Uncharacterized protein n=1 Tax=Pleurodeles waltl TaxID=8319 RepID=A0AAV7PHG9_PLEWA|nr:hypothetical protein NDU88_006139 [Pleurodeles waltl]
MVPTAADVTTIFYLYTHLIPDIQQERTYTASAAVTSVWKRQWLMFLGKGPLPSLRRSWRSQRPPEEGYLAYHRQGRPDPGGPPLTERRKRWEDIRHWSKKTVEAQLGMASQHGRGARRTMTPLMFRILAVAYPELDGRLRSSEQP